MFRNEGGYGALHNWDTKLDTKIREELSGSFVSFAISGDPNHQGMNHWEPCTPGRHATFLFWDGDSETRINHDAELVAMAKKHDLVIDLAKIMKR